MFVDISIKIRNSSFSNADLPANKDRGIVVDNFSISSNRQKIVTSEVDNFPPEIRNFLSDSDPIYKDIIADLQHNSQLIRNINCKRVIETTLACAKIDQLVDRIAGLGSELERIKFIAPACGINTEPDFLSR